MFKYKMACLLSGMVMIVGCAESNKSASVTVPQYDVLQAEIKVDGIVSDWEGIKANVVRGSKYLWIGQGLTLDNWKGNDDLSFSWKAARKGNTLYFLIDVTDDKVVEPAQEFSWMNDCIEIYLNPGNLKGVRIANADVSTPIAERVGKDIRGYETHFLPAAQPKVFLDDTVSTYETVNPQNKMFEDKWKGKVVKVKSDHGYIMEIEFTVPGSKIIEGGKMGIDVGVCDDDGDGRKSLMLWTADKGHFWIDMDNWGNLKFVGGEE